MVNEEPLPTYCGIFLQGTGRVKEYINPFLKSSLYGVKFESKDPRRLSLPGTIRVVEPWQNVANGIHLIISVDFRQEGKYEALLWGEEDKCPLDGTRLFIEVSRDQLGLDNQKVGLNFNNISYNDGKINSTGSSVQHQNRYPCAILS